MRLPISPLRQMGGVPDHGTVPARLTEIHAFGSNPGALRMFVHVPPRLPKGAPLVVILHGCGQSAAGYDFGAGWSALGERLGFAVLAPEQQAANNAGGCFNWFQSADQSRELGEAASIRQMIARMIADHAVDARRIFITGLSAGGAMTAVMLAAYPELFAGGAIHSGLPFGGASNIPAALNLMRQAPKRSAAQWGQAVRNASSHAGRWPILSVWHGDADMTVHVSNAEAVIAQWTDLHGLAAQPPQTEQGKGYLRRRWRDPGGEVVVESYTIAGMGHGVPIHAEADEEPGGGHAGPYFLEAGLSSTRAIAAFWGLPPAPPVVEAPAEPPAQTSPPPLPEISREIPQARSAAAPDSGKGNALQALIVKALKAAGLLKK